MKDLFSARDWNFRPCGAIQRQSHNPMAKEREMRDLQNQMDEKTLQHKLETRKLLTPEQISQFGQSMGRGPFFGRGPMMDRNMRMHHRSGPSMGW
jgi:hypothetical protein